MKKERFSVQEYFSHIKQSIEKIENYTQNVSCLDEFLANPMICDAVIRNIEIIGEASNNIRKEYPQFLENHTEIAQTLRSAYEMRNSVIHGYIEVDYNIVYRTIELSLPAFKEQIYNLDNEEINQSPEE
ncbi:DUF86 domain-containing protein [Pelistega sp. MC2]|uniref:HepT-like ribonuclease domain-containing protein n=1 Tax=Pelistega sp. MC2 TaxID=1720297 RepID=UPI0008D99BD3|nr:HepT-like ribonuclease domain-containing protein [Pelistega sp. MC2]